MKPFFLLFALLSIVGCAAPQPVFKAGPESGIQMSNEADRLRVILDRHLISKDKEPSNAIYRKALQNESIE